MTGPLASDDLPEPRRLGSANARGQRGARLKRVGRYVMNAVGSMIATLFPWSDAAAGDCEPECERTQVWRACDPGAPVLAHGALTFLPARAGTVRGQAAWATWLRERFVPHLVPVLLAAREHAGHGRTRELLALDRALAETLDPPVAARLATSGRALLATLLPMAAAGWPRKLAADPAAGQALFPVVHAGRCALFHLPPRAVLLGYALCEWRAACSTHSEDEFALAATAAAAVLGPVQLQLERSLGPRESRPGPGRRESVADSDSPGTEACA